RSGRPRGDLRHLFGARRQPQLVQAAPRGDRTAGRAVARCGRSRWLTSLLDVLGRRRRATTPRNRRAAGTSDGGSPARVPATPSDTSDGALPGSVSGPRAPQARGIGHFLAPTRVARPSQCLRAWREEPAVAKETVSWI